MSEHEQKIHRVASRRMFMFSVIMLLISPLAAHWLGWRLGLMIGFDVAAVTFIASCVRLLRLSYSKIIQAHAQADEDNRWVLLGISSVVILVILSTVASELMTGTMPPLQKFPFIIATIMLSWVFGNLVYALHYAHMHYGTGKGCDSQGLVFPGTPYPNYWDFVYFAVAIGVAFATSDVNIESPLIRRVVTAHSLIAFVFNIGVVGFTINLLAGLH